MSAPADPASPTRAQIHQYVWARYVNHEAAPFPLDEDRALEQLMAHYGEHPMQADAECFYYGILAYERSFAHPTTRQALLEQALLAFQAYRRQTSPGFTCSFVDDRYQDILELLQLGPETRAPRQ